MSRIFRTPDYESTLNQVVKLGDALPPSHLARFVVDIIAQLDLSGIYAQYAPIGGAAIAPEVLLGLLFYAYATDVSRSRKIERATYESIPFRFIAGGRLDIANEMTIRQERLANLAKAKAVLEERARERHAAEQAEYEAKVREREEKARKNRRKPRGRALKPPRPGPRDKDQYNFTDPDSRIMKNSTDLLARTSSG
jgi:transposase